MRPQIFEDYTRKHDSLAYNHINHCFSHVSFLLRFNQLGLFLLLLSLCKCIYHQALLISARQVDWITVTPYSRSIKHLSPTLNNSSPRPSPSRRPIPPSCPTYRTSEITRLPVDLLSHRAFNTFIPDSSHSCGAKIDVQPLCCSVNPTITQHFWFLLDHVGGLSTVCCDPLLFWNLHHDLSIKNECSVYLCGKFPDGCSRKHILLLFLSVSVRSTFICDATDTLDDVHFTGQMTSIKESTSALLMFLFMHL